MKILCAAVVLLTFAAALPGALAQEDEIPVVLRLNGTEGPDCPVTSLVLVCFIPTEGDPSTAFVGGETVRVELTAAGDAPHALAVIDAAEQSPIHLLTGELATPIAESDIADAGQTVTLEFTVPESGTLYFFCTVPDHEPIGMWFESAVQPGVADPLDNNSSGPETQGNETSTNETASNDDGTSTGVSGSADAGGDANATTSADDDAAKTEESPVAGVVPVLAVAAALGLVLRRRLV